MAATNHNFQIIISESQQFLTNIKNYLMAENDNLCKNIGQRKQENGNIQQAIKESLSKQKDKQYLYMDFCAELEQQATAIKLSYDELNSKLNKCSRASSVVESQMRIYLRNSRNKLEELLNATDMQLQPYLEIEKRIANLKQENTNLLQNIAKLKNQMKTFVLEDKRHYTEFKQLETCLLSVHMKQQIDIHGNEFCLHKMK